MPEGDTIHRAATRLHAALAGATVVAFRAERLVGDRPVAGESVDGVEAVGKHLLMHFSGGLTLRTHMRMTGSWHLYRSGERWRKAPYLARAVIEVDTGWCAVCFAAPVVETYRRAGGLPAAVAGLGPDLCQAEVDIDAVLERLEQLLAPETEIADALLDQRVAAGIGNVYKSEVLFVCGVDPFVSARSVSPEILRRIYETANRLLLANLGTSSRVTYDGGLAVYSRSRQPCRRCGTPIRMARQGPHARSTYWCPTCQRAHQ